MHQAHGSGFYAPIEKHLMTYIYIYISHRSFAAIQRNVWMLFTQNLNIAFKLYHGKFSPLLQKTPDSSSPDNGCIVFFSETIRPISHNAENLQCFMHYHTISGLIWYETIYHYPSYHIIYLFPLGRACRSHFIWHIMCREAVPSSSSQEKYKQKSSNWDTACTYAAH